VSGAIKIALDLVQHDMIGQMLEDVKGANEILRPFPSTPQNSS
jgi:hypothetical protein